MGMAEELENVIYKESSEARDRFGLETCKTSTVLQVLHSLMKMMATISVGSPSRTADVAGLLCSRGGLR